jgi:hypothetical protein
MPGRVGQLDQISEAIGEIRGTVAALGRYIHEERHGVRNLTAKVDGLSTQVSRDIAAAKGEISATVSTALERVEARIATIDERVSALETIKDQEKGAKGILVAVLQSPVLAWVFAVAVVAWTALKGTAK